MYLRTRILIIVLALSVYAPLTSAQHLGDVWVGRSGQDQVAISPFGFVPDMNYHAVLPVSGLLNGWSDSSPGFDHTTVNDPTNNVFPLEVGAQIWLQIVAIDAALRIIDTSFNILDEPGESTYLGGYNVHSHNTWHINSDDPAFDPQQCVWHLTVLLRDDGSTGYGASTPFTFYFTNVVVRPPAQPATGDFDDSGTVGSTDWQAFGECFNGPDVRPSPDEPAITTCEVTCLNAFDFDNDLDVDVVDYAAFQRLYTGGN